MLERAHWGRVGKVTGEGGERWGSPRLRLKLFLIGVKLGQRLREQDEGQAAQLPFLTYLSHGGGGHQLRTAPNYCLRDTDSLGAGMGNTQSTLF